MIDYNNITGYLVNSTGLRLSHTVKLARNIKVYYHGSCADGACSAALLAVLYPRPAYNVSFHVATYDVALDPETFDQDDLVILVDFATAPAVMQAIHDRTQGLLVIDHHKSAVERIMNYQSDHGDGCFGYVLGGEYYSGASLVHRVFFDCLHPEKNNSVIRQVVRRFRTHDLWEHKGNIESAEYGYVTFLYSIFENLPPQEMSAAMVEFIEDVLTSTEGQDESDLDKAIKQIDGHSAMGIALLHSKTMEAETYLKSAKLQDITVETAVHSAVVVKAPYRFASMLGTVGSAAYPNADFILIYETSLINPDKYKVSLRTRKEGTVDLSAVATHFGGGGHKAAAGFYIAKNHSLCKNW